MHDKLSNFTEDNYSIAVQGDYIIEVFLNRNQLNDDFNDIRYELCRMQEASELPDVEFMP